MRYNIRIFAHFIGIRIIDYDSKRIDAMNNALEISSIPSDVIPHPTAVCNVPAGLSEVGILAGWIYSLSVNIYRVLTNRLLF